MSGPTDLASYQRDLLDKLGAVKEQIEGHRNAVIELEYERRRLEYQLRNSGWRPTTGAEP